jgi:hypothetical protein
MANKRKEQKLNLDVAKAIWETYANIMLEKWVKKLAYAVASGNMDAVRAVGKEMEKFKFDFNRGKNGSS